MIDNYILFFLLVVIVFVGVMIFVFQLSLIKKIKNQALITDALLSNMEKEMSQLRGYLSEPVSKLFEIEQRNRRLTERLEQMEVRDKSSRQFGQAASLMSKGSSIDEIVTTCGISRGEAELISVMHEIDDEDDHTTHGKKAG